MARTTSNPPPAAVHAQRTILVVDDAPDNLVVLSELLQPHYRVRAAISGARALEIARTEPRPDLVLLDIMMPEMDGYNTLRRLRADPGTRDIPVIFVTALSAAPDEAIGLAMGAVDYIAKPYVPAVVLARVKTHLQLKEARDWLRDRNSVLETELSRRMADVLLVQDVSIRALARLAEVRDPETGNHLLRTQGYMRTLAERLRTHARFSAMFTPAYIELLVKSAPLHDIGKVGIPDHILLKPGPLDDAEWSVMKTHAALGSEAIELAERDADRPVEFLRIAKEIARWHHEHWDGGGYPDRLEGDTIPASARLMALADVFDALVSRRVYKPPMSVDMAVTLISEGRGRQFDPDVVDAFLAARPVFAAIAARFPDSREVLDRKADLVATGVHALPDALSGSQTP